MSPFKFPCKMWRWWYSVAVQLTFQQEHHESKVASLSKLFIVTSWTASVCSIVSMCSIVRWSDISHFWFQFWNVPMLSHHTFKTFICWKLYIFHHLQKLLESYIGLQATLVMGLGCRRYSCDQMQIKMGMAECISSE